VLIEPSGFATDWAGDSAAETRPEDEIADYAGTAGEYRRTFRAGSGKEAGDPERAAAAIVDIASDINPPLRLCRWETSPTTACWSITLRSAPTSPTGKTSAAARTGTPHERRPACIRHQRRSTMTPPAQAQSGRPLALVTGGSSGTQPRGNRAAPASRPAIVAGGRS
jgi:hypothetical protein